MHGWCIDVIFIKSTNLKTVKKFVYDCTSNAPNPQWKLRKNDRNHGSIMNNIENAVLRDIDEISSVTMNNSYFNNQYSQNHSQTRFDTMINSATMNPLLLGHSNHQLNYLNHYNLLNSTGLNINISTNNERNTNYERNNYQENPFNQNQFKHME